MLHHQVSNRDGLGRRGRRATRRRRVADVVERADVRVGQGGDRARLPIEPLPRLAILGRVPRQDLDRHGSIETRIPRPVDLAHTAGAEAGRDQGGGRGIRPSSEGAMFTSPQE